MFVPRLIAHGIKKKSPSLGTFSFLSREDLTSIIIRKISKAVKTFDVPMLISGGIHGFLDSVMNTIKYDEHATLAILPDAAFAMLIPIPERCHILGLRRRCLHRKFLSLVPQLLLLCRKPSPNNTIKFTLHGICTIAIHRTITSTE